MRIAAIGTGNIGGTLGRRWSDAGHDVRYGSRNPDAGAGEVSVGEAIAGSEVILLAVPGGAVDDVLAEHAGEFGGRIVVDATNVVGAGKMNHVAEIADAAPTATVVRAFNTVGWEVFDDPRFDAGRADLFWCGDADAATRVERLVGDLGMRPVRVGDLDRSDVVDGVARLWFALALGEGHGRRLGFRMLT